MTASFTQSSFSQSPVAPRSPSLGTAVGSVSPRANAVDASDFTFLQEFVRVQSAIVLDPGKEYLVESRLAPVMRQLGLASIGQVVARVKARDSDATRRVIDAMTTNETSWFRDIHPFEALKSTLLPELIGARSKQRELSIWCAASSSGQEPYTLAMIIKENFPQLSGWKIRIVATDLSHAMVDRVKEGRYSQLEMNRGLPASYLVKWFDRVGTDWQVKPELRSMVDARVVNLAEPWGLIGSHDIVMLRNVLIYFARPTKAHILDRVRTVLRPDGVLFLGASETTFNIDDRWASRTVGKAIAYGHEGSR
jgi:chemotaxis protein methyltransferase CheR